MNRLLWSLILVAGAAWGGIVSDVRVALNRHDLKAAERQVAAFRKQNGSTPEALEALSWLGRGALEEGRREEAERYAGETRKLVLEQLKTRRLDADKHLAAALGAAIEVHAEVLAGRGQRSEAVSFLGRELKTYLDTPIRTRIQKNLNVLSLEGKPAPPLNVDRWLGPRPESLAALRGRPVLLFFWAHWCPDCKDEVPVLAKVAEQFSGRGLVLVGPTQHYGYVAKGEEAAPERETPYIDTLRRAVYAPVGAMPVPLDEENFKVYGASTVPTLVLIDRRGIVRLYHPDVMPYEELAVAIERVLAGS
jgi:thiol-disulfide isomerase/thioredoxin